jgi:putative transcriptional regulator
MTLINLDHQHHADLIGSLLVATPLIAEDSPLNKAVILVIQHHKLGSIGLIVNSPLDPMQAAMVSYAFDKKHQDEKLKNISIYFGGPLEPYRGLILHSCDDYNKGIISTIANGVAISSNAKILKDISKGKGPSKRLLALGCAGWQGGQLEQEIMNNQWLIIPFSEKIIFDDNNCQKWDLAMQSIGIKQHCLHMSVGNA